MPAITKEGENLSSSWLVCLMLVAFQVAFTCGTFIFYSCSFFILVPSYNLSVTWVSAVGYIFVVVQIYTTVMVGYYGDRIISRYGRRKPLVLIGYCITCFGSLMMSQLSPANAFGGRSGDPNTDDGKGYSTSGIHASLVPSSDGNMIAMQMWMLISNLLVAFGSTIFSIPFNSWFFESSRNSQDYSTIQLYCLNIGSAVGYLMGIYALYVYPRTALSLGAISLICLGLPILCSLCYFVHNRIVRDEEKAPAVLSDQTVDTEAVRQLDQPLMLPSIRLLFTENPEFRRLLANTIILNTGNGLVGEFVSYSAYILFPAIRHYKKLLSLAALFFLGSFAISALVTAAAKPLWLEYFKMDKLVLYRRLMLGFVVGCGLAFAINIPGLFTEAMEGTNIGTDDLVEIEDGNVRWMVVVYILIQVVLSAMAALATYLNLMFTRDVVRWDEYRTGRNRSNMYQSALNIPPKILIGFLISIPQIIFYSSGYRAITYNFEHDPDSGETITDDLIDHKWTWTVASYYEIVFFQCILSAFLAYLAWKVFQNYYLTSEVVDRVDAVLAKKTVEEDERMANVMSRQATVMTGVGSVGGGMATPLLATTDETDGDDENLPFISLAQQRRALTIYVGMTEDDETQLILHLTDNEFRTISAENSWTCTSTTTYISKSQESLHEGSSNQSEWMIAQRLSAAEKEAEERTSMLSSAGGAGAGGAGLKGRGSVGYEHTAGGSDRSEVTNTTFRNVGLEHITRCHQFGLYVASPFLLILLLVANYTQIWKRANSPYLPLSVNMFCACTVYVFYELLRRPIFKELNRTLRSGPMVLRKGARISGNRREKNMLIELDTDPHSNRVGKDFLQALLDRATIRADYRSETLEELLARGKAAGLPNNGVDIISPEYDPHNAIKVRVVPSGEQEVINALAIEAVGLAPTLVRPSQYVSKPLAGYAWTFVFLLVLTISGFIMIFVL